MNQKKLHALLKKTKGQVLILVPEVSMLAAYGKFGTLYYAGLKQSEKKEIWDQVHENKIQVIIGTQKALFLPFKNLTTIIIDEEQYESHKLWDQYPRLHTVRGAEILAQVWNATVIYTSSYPSVRLRYMMETSEYKTLIHNPVHIQTDIIPFSFEDRKWKRPLPNDAGTQIRAWARAGKKVLVLYNKKDNQKIQEALHYRLSKKAKANIFLGTTSLLTDASDAHYDRVVWIAPELTMRAIDYRSSERARILAARLQVLTPKQPITVVTRNTDLTQQILGATDSTWYERVLKERRMLNLPPFTDLVRLTVRDKNAKKAASRAENIAAMLRSALEQQAHTRVFGPYQERNPKKSKFTEYHILLSGKLETLVEAYKDLPIDSADIDPQRIV